MALPDPSSPRRLPTSCLGQTSGVRPSRAAGTLMGLYWAWLGYFGLEVGACSSERRTSPRTNLTHIPNQTKPAGINHYKHTCELAHLPNPFFSQLKLSIRANCFRPVRSAAAYVHRLKDPAPPRIWRHLADLGSPSPKRFRCGMRTLAHTVMVRTSRTQAQTCTSTKEEQANAFTNTSTQGLQLLFAMVVGGSERARVRRRLVPA